MRISLLKKIDALVGSFFCRLLPPAYSDAFTSDPKSILVIRPGGIGDAVLLVPTISALKTCYPACRIDVLAERRNAGAFSLCPEVSDVLLYDRPITLLRVLRRSYDVIIDTEQWHRLSAVVTRLVRAKIRIGFGTNERRRLFSYAVDYSHNCYEVDSFLHLLVPLGFDLPEPELPFLTVFGSAQAAGKLLEPLGGRDFIVLFPGASIVERRWPVERFHALAAKLSGLSVAIVVVGGSEDLDTGNLVCEGLPHALNLAGRTSLAETAGILKESRLLISGDSGVLHIAVGLDVPTVSLFGPGIAAKWAPRGDRHRVINLEMACSPCTRFGTTPPCPIGAKCIQNISVDRVWREVQTLLDLTSGD